MEAGRRFRPLGSLRFLGSLLFLLSCVPLAHASAAVLLEEPYGLLGRWNPSGHVALYLDHVCVASPVVLRPCRPGEQGSVLSRYDGIDSHDWVAMPLLGYLYAVSQPEDIPVTVDRATVARLREAYRRNYLQAVAPNRPNGSAPDGNWYELAGAAFDRTIYGFQVDTTPEQDAALIVYLNDRENRNVYNGAFRNCADFVRVTMNRFYPHAIRRNFIADLGLTSPKAVARGLAHYAGKHPETGFTSFRVSQLSGTLPRSHPAVTLTEGIVKEFGIPLAVLSPVTTGVLMTAYIGHGRFAEPREAPVLNLRTDVVLDGGLNLRTNPATAVAGSLVAAAPGASAGR